MTKPAQKHHMISTHSHEWCRSVVFPRVWLSAHYRVICVELYEPTSHGYTYSPTTFFQTTMWYCLGRWNNKCTMIQVWFQQSNTSVTCLIWWQLIFLIIKECAPSLIFHKGLFGIYCFFHSVVALKCVGQSWRSRSGLLRLNIIFDQALGFSGLISFLTKLWASQA